MVLYALLFLGNQAFSMYLVFGKVLNNGQHVRLPHDVTTASQHAFSTTGQETFLGKQLFELLFPGSLLIPYLIWPFTGYPLRRFLRRFNNFIPFTDDPRSARALDVRNTEIWLEPPLIYIAWDYSAHITLPACAGLFFYLA